MRVKALASKILALSASQMLHEWQTRYGYRPLLLETLVDTQRFRSTCYRAANWVHVGQTGGRGRMDREHERHGEVIVARLPATRIRFRLWPNSPRNTGDWLSRGSHAKEG